MRTHWIVVVALFGFVGAAFAQNPTASAFRSDAWTVESFESFLSRRYAVPLGDAVARGGEIAVLFPDSVAANERTLVLERYGFVLNDTIISRKGFIAAQLKNPQDSARASLLAFFDRVNALLRDPSVTFVSPIVRHPIAGVREALTPEIHVVFRGDIAEDDLRDLIRNAGFIDSAVTETDDGRRQATLRVSRFTGRDVANVLLQFDPRFHPWVVSAEPVIAQFDEAMAVTCEALLVEAPLAFPRGIVRDPFRLNCDIVAMVGIAEPLLEEWKTALDSAGAGLRWAPFDTGQQQQFAAVWFEILSPPAVEVLPSSDPQFRRHRFWFDVKLNRAGSDGAGSIVVFPPVSLSYRFTSLLAGLSQRRTVTTPSLAVEVGSLLPSYAPTAPEPPFGNPTMPETIERSALEQLAFGGMAVGVAAMAVALVWFVFLKIAALRRRAKPTSFAEEWERRRRDLCRSPRAALSWVLSQRFGVDLPAGVLATDARRHLPGMDEKMRDRVCCILEDLERGDEQAVLRGLDVIAREDGGSGTQ